LLGEGIDAAINNENTHIEGAQPLSLVLTPATQQDVTQQSLLMGGMSAAGCGFLRAAYYNAPIGNIARPKSLSGAAR